MQLTKLVSMPLDWQMCYRAALESLQFAVRCWLHYPRNSLFRDSSRDTCKCQVSRYFDAPRSWKNTKVVVLDSVRPGAGATCRFWSPCVTDDCRVAIVGFDITLFELHNEESGKERVDPSCQTTRVLFAQSNSISEWRKDVCGKWIRGSTQMKHWYLPPEKVWPLLLYREWFQIPSYCLQTVTEIKTPDNIPMSVALASKSMLRWQKRRSSCLLIV